ncbi:MAG TPA: response regulator [Pirellulales bacterium]|nr:response regulator [Pirellulales bacterium]
MVPLRVATIAKRLLLSHAPDTGAAAASGSGAPAEPLRVLVVEDNFDVGEVLGKTLSDWGYTARVCTLAGEALALAPYFRPQVVVVDLGLPDLDGWELVRQLRQQRPTEPPLFIAVTAHGEDEAFRKSESVGITYHLVKPSYQRQLQQILDRYANGT